MRNFTKHAAYLLITTGSIISCSKSSDPSPSLVGTWNVSSFSVTGCTDGAANIADTPCGTLGVTVVVSCETWVFTATTVSVTGGIIPIVLDYTLTGNTIAYKLSGTTVATGTYVVTPTTLSITTEYGSYSMGCKMVENFTKQ